MSFPGAATSAAPNSPRTAAGSVVCAVERRARRAGAIGGRSWPAVRHRDAASGVSTNVHPPAIDQPGTQPAPARFVRIMRPTSSCSFSTVVEPVRNPRLFLLPGPDGTATLFPALVLLIALDGSSCRADRTLAASEVSSSGFPTFQVECRNETMQSIDRLRPIKALRFDGTLVTLTYVGSQLGGLPPPATPGSSWIEVISLVPPSRLGYGLNWTTVTLPMQAGRHTVAFQCGGLWSREVRFDWQPR